MPLQSYTLSVIYLYSQTNTVQLNDMPLHFVQVVGNYTFRIEVWRNSLLRVHFVWFVWKCHFIRPCPSCIPNWRVSSNRWRLAIDFYESHVDCHSWYCVLWQQIISLATQVRSNQKPAWCHIDSFLLSAISLLEWKYFTDWYSISQPSTELNPFA